MWFPQVYDCRPYPPPGVTPLTRRGRQFEEGLNGHIAIQFYHIPPSLYPQLLGIGNFLSQPCRSRHNKPLMDSYAVLSRPLFQIYPPINTDIIPTNCPPAWVCCLSVPDPRCRSRVFPRRLYIENYQWHSSRFFSGTMMVNDWLNWLTAPCVESAARILSLTYSDFVDIRKHVGVPLRLGDTIRLRGNFAMIPYAGQSDTQRCASSKSTALTSIPETCPNHTLTRKRKLSHDSAIPGIFHMLVSNN